MEQANFLVEHGDGRLHAVGGVEVNGVEALAEAVGRFGLVHTLSLQQFFNPDHVMCCSCCKDRNKIKN